MCVINRLFTCKVLKFASAFCLLHEVDQKVFHGKILTLNQIFPSKGSPSQDQLCTHLGFFVDLDFPCPVALLRREPELTGCGGKAEGKGEALLDLGDSSLLLDLLLPPPAASESTLEVSLSLFRSFK